MTRQVGVVAAVAILAALTLQGCEMPGTAAEWQSQFSEVSQKALGQASHFVHAAREAAPGLLKAAGEQAAKLKEEASKKFAEAKKKAEDLHGDKLKEFMDKAKEVHAAAMKKAGEVVAEGKKAAAELKEKAAKAMEAVKKGKLLEQAKAAAEKAAKAAHEHYETMKAHGADALEKAKAKLEELKEGSDAYDKAKKALESLKDQMAEGLKKTQAAAEAAKDKATEAAHKAHAALTEAEEASAEAKKAATDGGADERLFELPAELKNELSTSNSATYYAGLASISLVSISFTVLAVRKFSAGRRTAVSQSLEDGVE